jgi:hypothetical protein
LKSKTFNRNGRKVRKGEIGFGFFAFPIPAMTRDVGDHGDLPTPFVFLRDLCG